LEVVMRGIVQILIVALILLVVGGLLTAFVVRVQEAAAQTQCQNNLKMIALGTFHFADAKGHVPLAARPNPNLPVDKRLSWLFDIGPFVEADVWYSRAARDKSWDAEENRYLAVAMFSRTYHCPAFPDRPPTSTLIPTHYVGLTGLGEDAATLPLSDPRAGFFGYERKLTFADIEGRTSTQLIVFETSRVHGAWSAGGPPTARGLVADEPYLGPNGQFGGIHRGGAVAALANGTVRFFANSTDPAVLEAMAVVQRAATEEPANEE
jgi:hypothetical protein